LSQIDEIIYRAIARNIELKLKLEKECDAAMIENLKNSIEINNYILMQVENEDGQHN